MARAQGLALLGRWQRQALAEAVPISTEREEIKRLRAELKRVQRERDMLKKVKPSLRSRLQQESLPVQRAGCGHRARAGALLRATRQCRWLLSVVEAGSAPYTQLGAAASAAFSRHAQRYGTRRLRAELCAQGHAVGRYALRSWLRRGGLRSLSTRPQRPRTTVADPEAVVAENLTPRPARAYRAQPGVGRGHYLSAPSRRALVLCGHLARYLPAAGSRLAPRPTDAH